MSFVRNVLRDPPKSLTKDQQHDLLEVTGEHIDGFRDFVILSVALGTFLRESEIAALNVGDVVADMPSEGDAVIRSKIQLRTFKKSPRRKVRNGTAANREEKSPSHQRVFLPKSVRRKLVKYFSWKKKRGEPTGPADPLFLSRRGDRLSTRMMRHMFHQWQRIAGFAEIFSFHVLRHTGISNFYRKTRDLHLTGMQARHASINTTQLYTHLNDEELQAAIEDLDEEPLKRRPARKPRRLLRKKKGKPS